MIVQIETKIIKKVSIALISEDLVRDEYVIELGDIVTIKYIDNGALLTTTGKLTSINDGYYNKRPVCSHKPMVMLTIDSSTVNGSSIDTVISDNIREIIMVPEVVEPEIIP